jgi:tRNA 2-thiouridine synthesizing protein A
MSASSDNLSDIVVSQEVDARGLNCPLPILKAKKALALVQSGEIVKIVSTDSGSKRDFEAPDRQCAHLSN